MKIKITYTQSYMGELIDDSYIRFIENINEIDEIIDILHEDPHVIGVHWEEIEEKGD